MQRALRVGLLLGWIGLAPAGWAAERLALVIGNARYLNERPLINTLNDARAVADQLRGLGFAVTLHEDLAAIPMRREVNRYLEEVKGREGTVLFYYSGHGMQDRYRASYLLPVDAKVTGQEDIVAYGVGLNDVLEKLGERPRDAVSLVIVDACRDNPFATQKGGKGLGRVEAGRGTLVLYAAGPGQTADDRPGEPNGLFTQHLLKVLPQPGLDLEDAFDRIAEAVERASNGQQVPYKEGDLRGKYYLAGPLPPTLPPAPLPVVDHDLIAWQSAEKCGTPACFRAYLEDYPKGRYARMALARLEPTSTPTPVITTQPTPVPLPLPAETTKIDRPTIEGAWEIRNGNWEISNGNLRSQGGEVDSEILYKKFISDNYMIEVNAMPLDGAGKSAIIFCYTGKNHFYQLEISASDSELFLWESVNWRKINNVKMPIFYNTWYRLKIILKNKKAQFFVNDKVVFTIVQDKIG